MSRYIKARVSENIRLNNDHYLLTFIPQNDSRNPDPGQFYMVGTDKDNYDPLLNRPFSVFRITPSGPQILYRIKGRGTALMRNLKEGSIINVLGPLGNSYPMPEKNKTPLVIAGGIGIASVFSLAERLSGKAHIFYGARSAEDLFCLGELRGFAKEMFVSTDDGSYGEKGNIVDVLNRFLTQNTETPQADRTPNLVLYACGPRPMFKALWGTVKDKGIKTYVSLEENMACGIGACLGCAVRTLNGYERVCNEGPVFSIEGIVW